MAITFVGWGTSAEANNASVSPGMPSGVQNGDLVICTCFIKENAATWGTPTDWTAGPAGQGTAVESSIAFFGRIYDGTWSMPTFTPSGGGSNDTCLARAMALRGTHQTDFFGSESFATETASGNALYYYPPTGGMEAGEAYFLATSKGDDSTGETYPYIGTRPTNSTALQTAIGIYSILGSDATLGFFSWVATAAKTSSDSAGWGQFYPTAISNPTHAFGFIVKPQASVSYPYTASGGDKDGGIALAEFSPYPDYPYTASGGDKDGGIALTEWVDYGTYVSAGGDVDGGRAGYQFYPITLGQGAKTSLALYMAGVAKPVISLTLRHTLTEFSVVAVLAGKHYPALGAAVSVDITYQAGDITQSLSSAVGTVTEYSVGKDTTTIYADCTPLLGSGEYEIRNVQVAMTGRYRCPVDWQVRPGHTLGGLTINGVTTTLGSGQPWFTEVAYG